MMKRLVLTLTLALGGLFAQAAHETVSSNDLAGLPGSNDFWDTSTHVSGTVCESSVATDVLFSSLFVRSVLSSDGGNLNTFPPVGFLLFLK